jgi:hypothetical protein
MSLNNKYIGPWADGDYTFALNLAELEELQRRLGTEKDANGNVKPDPFGRIFSRVLSGEFYARDVPEIIRLGLIGGGTPGTRAKELVDTYVFGRPLQDFDDPNNPYAVACKILAAAMNGIEPVAEGREPQGEQDETADT